MLAIGLTSTEQVQSEEPGRTLDASLARLAAGDTAALGGLYCATSTAVYGFALSILKSPQDAEDVLCECYLRVHGAALSYRACGKPLAWMLTITRNLCLARLQDRQRVVQPPEDWERYWEAQEALGPEDRLVLAECMRHLSDEERQIVVLHAVAGFKHREIASLLSLALPTVLSKYHRALKKLQTLWEKGERQT